MSAGAGARREDGGAAGGRMMAAGAGLALLAVAAGAFGAHALGEGAGESALTTFETGVRYQMYHALALLLLGWIRARGGGRLWSVGGTALGAGVLVFSGSLYGIALGGPRWLGAVAPVGGALFLGGWATTAVAAWRLARHGWRPRGDGQPSRTSTSGG